MENKYPRQCYVVKRKGNTFATDLRLFSPTDSDSPMQMHSGFSVFTSTIIHTLEDGKKITPKANIPVHDISTIEQKTTWCNQKIWDNQMLSKNTDDIPKDLVAIYQTKMTGKYKSYTPAEYIMQKGEAGVKELKQHGNWLYENARKNPQYSDFNMKQVNLLSVAFKAWEEGRLKQSDEPQIPSVVISDIEIYKAGPKFFSETNKDGLNRCYCIKVSCDISKDYPYTVEITNYYASVKKMPDKTVRIGNENVGYEVAAMKLSLAEWTEFVNVIVSRKKEFEICNFSKQFRVMNDLAWKPE